MRFSTYRFFHDSNPSGPLINRLKYFRIWFRFHWDIQSQKCLRSVPHTMEINCTLRNQNQNLYLSMVTFKETIRRNPCKSNTSTIYIQYHEENIFISAPLRLLCDRIFRRNRNRNRIRKYFILLIRAPDGFESW